MAVRTAAPPGLDEAHQIGDPLAGLLFPAGTPVERREVRPDRGQPHRPVDRRAADRGRTPAVADSADSACPGLPASHDCIELDPGIYYGGWDIGSKVSVT